MSNIAVILVDNDSVFAVESLRNAQNGDYLNDATVSVHLRTSAGTDVSGATWPLIVDYVLGSNGLYRVTLPYTLALAPGGRYVATVVANGGPGLRAEWDIDCVARSRN